MLTNYNNFIHYLVSEHGCTWLLDGNIVKGKTEVVNHMFHKFEWSPEIGKDNLSAAKRILDKHNINYWLSFGTLLGIHRDNDLIVHDHDVDISLKVDEFEKFIGAYNDFVIEGFFPIRMSTTIGYPLISFERNNSYVDFYPFYKQRARFWDLYRFSIPDDQISELQNIHFNGEEYSTVKDIERYLIAHYGNDWKIPKKDSSAVESKW